MVDETTQDDEAVFEEPEADKTEGEPENEDEQEEEQPKNRKSAIAQKKYWREKAKTSDSKVQELETKLEELKGAVKKPDDEKEAAAQKYIRQQAREAFDELQLEKSKAEAKELAAFEDRVQEILDDNPDIAEDELLDTIEEYEVEPKTALKILQKKNEDPKEKKPRMPKARQASAQEDDGKKPDDSQKNMWQILKEEKAKLFKK